MRHFILVPVFLMGLVMAALGLSNLFFRVRVESVGGIAIWDVCACGFGGLLMAAAIAADAACLTRRAVMDLEDAVEREFDRLKKDLRDQRGSGSQPEKY